MLVHFFNHNPTFVNFLVDESTHRMYIFQMISLNVCTCRSPAYQTISPRTKGGRRHAQLIGGSLGWSYDIRPTVIWTSRSSTFLHNRSQPESRYKEYNAQEHSSQETWTNTESRIWVLFDGVGLWTQSLSTVSGSELCKPWMSSNDVSGKWTLALDDYKVFGWKHLYWALLVVSDDSTHISILDRWKH